jgi:hypothetical protein
MSARRRDFDGHHFDTLTGAQAQDVLKEFFGFDMLIRYDDASVQVRGGEVNEQVPRAKVRRASDDAFAGLERVFQMFQAVNVGELRANFFFGQTMPAKEIEIIFPRFWNARRAIVFICAGDALSPST